MFKNALWGAVGIRVNWEAGLDLAVQTGFDGVDVSGAQMRDAVAAGGAEKFLEPLRERHLVVGPWGLPTRWQGSDEEFQADLPELARQAAAAQACGADRCCTWVPSWSETRGWDENWQFHVDRFGQIARVLGDHGVRLGLEFLGPETLRRNHPHQFIYDCDTMVKLCREVGPNAGLLLDCWHWHASGGTREQLAALQDSDVVQVHVNDAPRGVELPDLVDNQRCLPGDTLVIDLPMFMQELARMGYTGPVGVEPFNAEVSAMPDVPAAFRVAASLDYLWSLI